MFCSSDPTTPQNSLARTEGPNLRASTNQNTSMGSRTEGRSRRPASSPFGSNIHALKRDEDDNHFGDRNSFWNGNSTQCGGDGKRWLCSYGEHGRNLGSKDIGGSWLPVCIDLGCSALHAD